MVWIIVALVGQWMPGGQVWVASAGDAVSSTVMSGGCPAGESLLDNGSSASGFCADDCSSSSLCRSDVAGLWLDRVFFYSTGGVEVTAIPDNTGNANSVIRGGGCDGSVCAPGFVRRSRVRAGGMGLLAGVWQVSQMTAYSSSACNYLFGGFPNWSDLEVGDSCRAVSFGTDFYFVLAAFNHGSLNDQFFRDVGGSLFSWFGILYVGDRGAAAGATSCSPLSCSAHVFSACNELTVGGACTSVDPVFQGLAWGVEVELDPETSGAYEEHLSDRLDQLGAELGEALSGSIAGDLPVGYVEDFGDTFMDESNLEIFEQFVTSGGGVPIQLTEVGSLWTYGWDWVTKLGSGGDSAGLDFDLGGVVPHASSESVDLVEGYNFLPAGTRTLIRTFGTVVIGGLLVYWFVVVFLWMFGWR